MSDQDPEIRVMLVDDQPLLREGIATILDAQAGIHVAAQASSGDEAIRTLGRTAVDVVCMDVQMPGIDGLEATRRITAEMARPPRILVLTTFGREDYLIEALRAGASGFLLKTARPEQLADAIRSVAAGDALLSPEVTRSVIRRAVAAERDGHAGQPPRSLPPQAEHLTDRELEVLRLVAAGLSNDEIAADLVIGRATVKTHVSNVLMKLHLRDRVQVVAFAYRHGLVQP
ncbi:response regulator transcription factor [Georgenia sp. H159]|uniref:response regulator transcription factor n=1 Tax=Georgenia sp. H159 TaxID=3076115 RepID=UPI002D79AB1C|nr:response regulator transcription factor [Georgenia sp. H159]